MYLASIYLVFIENVLRIIIHSKNEILESYMQKLKAKHKRTQHIILIYMKCIVSLEYWINCKKNVLYIIIIIINYYKF